MPALTDWYCINRCCTTINDVFQQYFQITNRVISSKSSTTTNKSVLALINCVSSTVAFVFNTGHMEFPHNLLFFLQYNFFIVIYRFIVGSPVPGNDKSPGKIYPFRFITIL